MSPLHDRPCMADLVCRKLRRFASSLVGRYASTGRLKTRTLIRVSYIFGAIAYPAIKLLRPPFLLEGNKQITTG